MEKEKATDICGINFTISGRSTNSFSGAGGGRIAIVCNVFLVHEWEEVQQLYDNNEIKDIKYNAIRWKQRVVAALINYALDVWNERCTFAHIESACTEDQRYRDFLKSKMMYLCEHKSALHKSDHFLVKKSDAFFGKCYQANLEM